MLGKKTAFIDKYKLRSVASFLTNAVTQSLGHGGVATYPDRPFLHWRGTFDKPRPGNGKVSDRDNPATFLEGCEKLHACFKTFAQGYYTDSKPVEFSEIQSVVDQILRFEGKKADREIQWENAITNNSIYKSESNEADIQYDHTEWEREKESFHDMRSSAQGIKTHIYKFHQVAALHRYYVLKELLPSHGIAVY